MHDAVADFVRDGDTVAIEGFTHLICFAAGHEIIRQGRRDLTLCRLTPDVVYDQMVGAGVASKLVFSWLGNPGVGSLHAIRRRIENDDPAPLEIEEYSHFGMVCRYVAGAAEPAVLPDTQLLRVGHPEGQPEHQGDALAVRRRHRGPRGPTAQARRVDRPRAACRRERRRPDLGAARLSEGGGLRGRSRDRGVRGAGRGVGDPRRPQPHRDPGRDRGRRGRGALRVPSVVRAGVLRPRQRVLPGVGRDRARRRDARCLVGRVGLWPCEPRASTWRRWAPRSGPTCAPSRRCPARSTTAGTHDATTPSPTPGTPNPRS